MFVYVQDNCFFYCIQSCNLYKKTIRQVLAFLAFFRSKIFEQKKARNFTKKKVMITKYFIFIFSSYHKNQLWSQNNYFAKVFLDFSKKDKNKCPKWENQNTFGKFILDHKISHRFLQKKRRRLW